MAIAGFAAATTLVWTGVTAWVLTAAAGTALFPDFSGTFSRRSMADNGIGSDFVQTVETITWTVSSDAIVPAILSPLRR